MKWNNVVVASGDVTGRLLLKYVLPVVERLDSLLRSYVAESFHVNSAFATPITPLRYVLGVPLNAVNRVFRIERSLDADAWHAQTGAERKDGRGEFRVDSHSSTIGTVLSI
ncbi:hypothetical protein Mal48_06860 [Thalassoglobus polymorphus]|uniref:Uncharacterized protein n=1 Tax=Thalassoglobus polymorphus TaxID=2527994 RepID=A0A517QIJ4_9PLAN|nr:hypothetical protein Mal48_06860 [Thalassoglobus polymorphus]